MKSIICRIIACIALSLPGLRSHAVPLTAESAGGLPAMPSAEAFSDPTAPLPPEIVSRLLEKQPEAFSRLGVELRKRLDQKPGDPYLMHGLATVLYHQGNVREAMTLWSGASKREPNLASAELMAAIHGVYALLAKGQTQEGQQRLAAAEKKFAQDPHFLLMRAEQAMRGNNLRRAEADYRKAHELAPRLYVTQLNLARFLDLGKHDAGAAAPRYEEATRLAPQRPEVWRHYADFLFRQDRIDAALAALHKVRALDANAPLPERQLAGMYAAAGRHEQARQWYLKARAQKPSAAELQSIRIALGDSLLRLKRFAEARVEISAALQVQEAAPLVFALATIDDAEGKFDAAERGYRRTLALMPANALATNNLAMLLLKTGKAAAEALSLAEKARAAIPDNAIIDGTWGCALAANGRGKEAIAALKPVAGATPNDPWVHYCLGKELAAAREVPEATRHLQQTLKLDPSFPRRDEVTRLLARLH